MSNESRVRDRIRFQEVAKLAETPEKSPGAVDEKKEDSGMIDLAAIAAGEGASHAPLERTPASSEQARAPSGDVANRPPPPPGQASPHPSSPPVSSSGVKTRQSLLSSSTMRAPMTGPMAAPRVAPGPSSGSMPSDRGDRATWSHTSPGLPTAPESGVVASGTHSPPETTRPTTAPTTRSTPVTADPERSKGPGTVWIALVGGVAVGALSAVIAFKMHESDASRSGMALANTLPAVTAPANGPASAPAEWKAATTTAARLGPEDRGVDLSALPAPAAATAAHPTAAAMVHALSGPVAQSAPPVVTPAAPPPPARNAEAPQAAPEPQRAAPSPPPAPTNPNSLEAMMKRAVRAESPAPAPVPVAAAAPAAPAAPAPAANLPSKPAMGAVMGALGAVMPAARYCLGPDDPVSRATITFKSDGSVESVTLAGDAAGQPAEACIRSRLVEARVPPFSSPKFTWTVPVRPAN